MRSRAVHDEGPVFFLPLSLWCISQVAFRTGNSYIGPAGQGSNVPYVSLALFPHWSGHL